MDGDADTDVREEGSEAGGGRSTGGRAEGGCFVASPINRNIIFVINLGKAKEVTLRYPDPRG